MSARILVVDDNALNVKLLAAKLAKDYYFVSTAEDGPRALEAVKRDMPDLVLLDVMMPDMDGFEVCTRLKDDPTTRHIPVVMVTALSDVKDRVRGLECGADDFLSKPINDIALMARVRSLLRLKMVMDEWRMREATALQMAGTGEAEEETNDKIKGHILILEDNPTDRAKIQSALAGVGITSDAAPTIAEAAAKASSGPYDMVLLSLDLKDEDGLFLCGQLRAQESTRNLPLLLIADEDEASLIARGLDLGASDYLMRPIESNELIARVRTQIKHKHHYDRLHENYERSLSLALVDPLTGAYNRRYLDNHLPMLFARCKATGRPLSVISIDLDHFKAVNDTHGHAAGDVVLKELVVRVLQNLRASDLVVRMGGEEFSVIMPEIEQKTALSAAERLRAALEATPFLLPNGIALPVTASFGVASVNHESDASPQTLLDRADAALYRAKETGRNKVVGQDQDS